MAYIINHTDGSKYLELGEGVLDQRLGISLIGQNFHNYGELIATNFLQLLENQSNTVPPTNPVEGQLWWNSALKQLNYFNGHQWKTTVNTTIHESPPIRPVDGDQWWDVSLHQLKIHDGLDWVVIGPVSPDANHFTGLTPTSVSDNSGAQHLIAKVVVDGTVIGFLNKDTGFTLATPIAGITEVGTGITLIATAQLTGSAQNSLQLGGVDANKYVRNDASAVSLMGSLDVLGVNGATIGSVGDPLRIYKDPSNAHRIMSNTATIKVMSGSTSISVDGVNNTATVSINPTVNQSITNKQYVDTLVANTNVGTRAYVDSSLASLVGNAAITSLAGLSHAVNNDVNFSINTQAALTLKAPTFSPDFTGTPQAPTQTPIDNTRKIATTAFVNNFVANGITTSKITVGGDILPLVSLAYNVGSPAKKFSTFYGNSMITTNADLAENYKPDAIYSKGTVVVFGGKYEVTVSDQYCDHRIAGIISTDPAYLMNENNDTGYQAVALTGKVPCLVAGPVSKGDILVNSGIPGVAKVLDSTASWCPGCVIGKSLEDNSDTGVRNITVAVGRF